MKKQLLENLKNIVAPHAGNKFTGIQAGKDAIEFFVVGESIISIFRSPLAAPPDFPRGMVDTQALWAAIRQTQHLEFDFEDGESRSLNIGRATLQMRDAPDLTDLSEEVTEPVPPALLDIIQTRLTQTFTGKFPKTVFGWECEIVRNFAHYGSATGPRAIYESIDIEAEDAHVVIPHDVCERLFGQFKNCTAFEIGKSLSVLHVGDVKHFTPVSATASSISIDDIGKITEGDYINIALSADKENKPLPDRLQDLMEFADDDTTWVFETTEANTLIVKVASKVGSSFEPIGRVEKKVNFVLRTAQVAPLTKIPIQTLYLAVRDKDIYAIVATSVYRDSGEHARKHYFNYIAAVGAA